MKKSKKILALALALIMAVSCLSASAYAVRAEEYVPTIIIPGLFQSETKYYENGKLALNAEGQPYEAPFFVDTTLEIVGAALTDVISPISKLLISQEDKDSQAANALADLLGETLFEKTRCDENGDFVHDVRATKYNASCAKLAKYNRDYILDKIPIQAYIDIAGAENLYFFTYASLGNMCDTIQELYDYIQFVKKDTGSDKVNLVPISQGGSIANGLMQMYEDLEGISIEDDVNRIVFVVPALDGSTLVGEIYEHGILDDNYELYNTIFPSLMGEDDWASYLVNIILRIMPNADINNILDTAVDTMINDYMRYSTLLWGLCPSENFEACYDKYLKDDKLETIAAEAEWYYGAQCNSDRNILNAIDKGVEIFDIVDYNIPLYQLVDSCNKVNADGIIQLDSTSMGAYSAGVDVKLPDDYVASCNNCSDPQNHDHADPNGIVDACTGLLPETTFYFHNQDHEKTAQNDVIMKLAAALLTDDNFTSVHSYPDKFPQFNECRNSRKFIKDIESMKSYDLSAVSNEDRVELETAINQAETVLNNTNVDLEEYEAATTRFYAIRDKIVNGKSSSSGDSLSSSSDNSLLQLMKFLSDLLFKLLGGAGFFE